MHTHQVPHAQCCPSGDVHSCTGKCRPEGWVGDHWCDADLECYCEEKNSPPCGGKPPVPVCSARWARCQNRNIYIYSGLGETLQARQVNHSVVGVLFAPSTLTPSFQAALALASPTAIVQSFPFRGNRASLWAKYYSLHSHLPLQTSQCIAGTVFRSRSNVSAHWSHSNIMLPALRVG